MDYIFDDEEHSIYVEKIMTELFNKKKMLKPFTKIKGFREKINNAFRWLSKIADGSYEGQEYITFLYAALTDNYIAANYYTEMNTAEDESGELAICSYNLEALLFDIKENKLYFLDRFHSNGEMIENEDGNFTKDDKTMHTEYILTKYYLDNNIPKVFKKAWQFNQTNYDKMRKIKLFDILDKVIDNTSSDSIVNFLGSLEQMNCIKS